jgi:hypothetical protein
MMTTTAIAQQPLNLDAISLVGNDFELDLESILASECEQGMPNDILSAL